MGEKLGSGVKDEASLVEDDDAIVERNVLQAVRHIEDDPVVASGQVVHEADDFVLALGVEAAAILGDLVGRMEHAEFGYWARQWGKSLPSVREYRHTAKMCTPAVRNCVRENRIFEIPNIIETSRALGMQTLDSSIKQLYVNGYISKDDAIAQAAHPEKLERALVA